MARVLHYLTKVNVLEKHVTVLPMKGFVCITASCCIDCASHLSKMPITFFPMMA